MTSYRCLTKQTSAQKRRVRPGDCDVKRSRCLNTERVCLCKFKMIMIDCQRRSHKADIELDRYIASLLTLKPYTLTGNNLCTLNTYTLFVPNFYHVYAYQYLLLLLVHSPKPASTMSTLISACWYIELRTLYIY